MTTHLIPHNSTMQDENDTAHLGRLCKLRTWGVTSCAVQILMQTNGSEGAEYFNTKLGIATNILTDLLVQLCRGYAVLYTQSIVLTPVITCHHQYRQEYLLTLHQTRV